jgi:hypothetical protein
MGQIGGQTSFTFTVIAFDLGSHLREMTVDSLCTTGIALLCVPTSLKSLTEVAYPARFPAHFQLLTFEPGSRLTRIECALFGYTAHVRVCFPASRDSIIRRFSWVQVFLIFPICSVADIRMAIKTGNDRTPDIFRLCIVEQMLRSAISQSDPRLSI